MTVNGNVCSFNLVKAVAMATLQQSRLKNRHHMTPLDILSQSGNNPAIDKVYFNIDFIACINSSDLVEKWVTIFREVYDVQF